MKNFNLKFKKIIFFLSAILLFFNTTIISKASDNNDTTTVSDQDLNNLKKIYNNKTNTVYIDKTNTNSIQKNGITKSDAWQYPTRKGVILVTSDSYKNLIPSGHSAIVISKSKVVESLYNDVQKGKNNWDFFNVETEEKFYCSQLVWRAFLNETGINLNTSFAGKAIYPLELATNNQVYFIYMH